MESILPNPSVSNGKARSSALVTVDDRAKYGELREVGYGFIGDRIHALTFTRRGQNVRIISLRKATKAEIRRYVEATT